MISSIPMLIAKFPMNVKTADIKLASNDKHFCHNDFNNMKWKISHLSAYKLFWATLEINMKNIIW